MHTKNLSSLKNLDQNKHLQGYNGDMLIVYGKLNILIVKTKLKICKQSQPETFLYLLCSYTKFYNLQIINSRYTERQVSPVSLTFIDAATIA